MKSASKTCRKLLRGDLPFRAFRQLLPDVFGLAFLCVCTQRNVNDFHDLDLKLLKSDSTEFSRDILLPTRREQDEASEALKKANLGIVAVMGGGFVGLPFGLATLGLYGQ